MKLPVILDLVCPDCNQHLAPVNVKGQVLYNHTKAGLPTDCPKAGIVYKAKAYWAEAESIGTSTNFCATITPLKP